MVAMVLWLLQVPMGFNWQRFHLFLVVRLVRESIFDFGSTNLT